MNAGRSSGSAGGKNTSVELAGQGAPVEASPSTTVTAAFAAAPRRPAWRRVSIPIAAKLVASPMKRIDGGGTTRIEK